MLTIWCHREGTLVKLYWCLFVSLLHFLSTILSLPFGASDEHPVLRMSVLPPPEEKGEAMRIEVVNLGTFHRVGGSQKLSANLHPFLAGVRALLVRTSSR